MTGLARVRSDRLTLPILAIGLFVLPILVHQLAPSEPGWIPLAVALVISLAAFAVSPIRALAIFALYMLLIDTTEPFAGERIKMLDEIFVPLVVFATAITRRSVILGRISPVRDAAVAVLLLAALASSLLNAVPFEVWVPGMLLLLKGMGLFYVVLLHDVTRDDARWISILVLGFGLVVLAVGLVELVNPGLVRGLVPGAVLPDRGGVPQIRSLFYHPQLFGWLCAVVALFLFAHYIVIGRRWMLVLALLFSVGIVLSARRRSILALGVGLGAGAAASVGRRPPRRSAQMKRSIVSAAGVVLLAAAFLPTLSALYNATARDLVLPSASPAIPAASDAALPAASTAPPTAASLAIPTSSPAAQATSSPASQPTASPAASPITQPTSSPAAVASIPNPGFETGDGTGWSAYDAAGYGGADDGTFSVERVAGSAAPVGAGSFQGVLTRTGFAGGGPRIFAAPVPVAAGDYLEVSATLGGDGAATLGVQWRTASGGYISESYGADIPAPAGTRYSQVLGPAPAAARWASAVVRNHAAAGATRVVVDDVAVAPGAAPAAGNPGTANQAQAATSPRMALYWGSVLVARDHFPLGAGLGRYGSWMSRIVYSDLYHQYGLDGIWGLGPTDPQFITDTFWPQILGETGLVGLLAYIVFLAALGLRLWRLARRRDLPADIAAIVLGTTMLFGETLVETVASAIFNSPSQIYLVMLLVAGTLSLVVEFDRAAASQHEPADEAGAA